MVLSDWGEDRVKELVEAFLQVRTHKGTGDDGRRELSVSVPTKKRRRECLSCVCRASCP